jgi:hypothetical protein
MNGHRVDSRDANGFDFGHDVKLQTRRRGKGGVSQSLQASRSRNPPSDLRSFPLDSLHDSLRRQLWQTLAGMTSTVDRLQVKIALLRLVSDCPEQPSVNTPSQFLKTQNSQSERVLSFKHELSITQQLAFICAYSHDPCCVTAVCIEEAAHGSALTVRFAANAGKHGKLIDGLKTISRILESEAKNGSVSPQTIESGIKSR